MARLPIKHDLTLAYLTSVVVLLMTVVSVVGLTSTGLYGSGPKLVQVSRGGDVANLIVGLPILVSSMWLTRAPDEATTAAAVPSDPN
jgi:hypothetical protein